MNYLNFIFLAVYSDPLLKNLKWIEVSYTVPKEFFHIIASYHQYEIQLISSIPRYQSLSSPSFFSLAIDGKIIKKYDQDGYHPFQFVKNVATYLKKLTVKEK